jgi:hypothetical protein
LHITQSRRLPGLTGSNAVKGENEIGYFGEDGAGDDLMLRGTTENSPGTSGIPAAWSAA